MSEKVINGEISEKNYFISHKLSEHVHGKGSGKGSFLELQMKNPNNPVTRKYQGLKFCILSFESVVT